MAELAKKIETVAAELKRLPSYYHEIRNESDYNHALNDVEYMFDNYDNYVHMIDILSATIKRYEDTAPDFEDFRKVLEEIDPGISMLRLLIDQHGLGLSDFENEIGKKSMVSQILNGQKNLSKKHIEKLSERFQISPALFFN